MSVFAIVGLLLAFSALAFVLYPLVKLTPNSEVVEEYAEVAERRRVLYRQILEIEFDHRLGKLDEADARELSESLLSQAAELLAGESTVQRDFAAEVEREILAVRRALAMAESQLADPSLPGRPA